MLHGVAAGREKRNLSRSQLAEKLNQKPIDPEWYLRSLRPASWQRNFEAQEVDREQLAELDDLPVNLYAGIESCKLFQPREFLGLLPQLRVTYVLPRI